MNKATSIKQNLIFRLSALLFVTLIVAYSFSLQNTKKEIYEVLDADIIKSAKPMFEIIKHESFVKNNISLDERLKQIIFEISNSGGKISTEEIERIFDNFYCINKSELERGFVGS